MMYETLPAWISMMFWLFFLLTLASGILSVIRRKLVILSLLTIGLSLIVPLTLFINSVGRNDGMNEWEFLIAQVSQGSTWAVFVVGGTILLLIWWPVFILRKKPIRQNNIAQ
ncbi:hypothetical protein ASD24_03790 [Paenibacillus sp. Root52]|nr:hypothetical protein ASD24_03790 [Paenibacillus sp. Root52]